MADEERIRARAYSIWIEEGRPEGHALTHWLRAEAEISAETEIREAVPKALAALGKPPKASATPQAGNGQSGRPAAKRKTAATQKPSAKKADARPAVKGRGGARKGGTPS